MVVHITVADGYPDKGCVFDLKIVPVRTSKSTEEEKKAVLTKFPDESPVEPVLMAIKTEIEEHYGDFCDSAKH